MPTPDIQPARERDREHSVHEPPNGLLDELLAYCLDWRHAASAAADAYRVWSDAPHADDAARFQSYLTALDEEESAAVRYALVAENVKRALWP